MALSAQFNVAEHLEEAFERIGFSPEAIASAHLTSAKRSIRTLLTTWNNDSVDFWKVVSAQHPQTLDEAVWNLPAGTIDVLRMAVLRDTYTTPMVILSQSDWFAIPDKASVRGMANRVWVERTIPTFRAHIYPYAENSTDILNYDYMVQFNDSTILNGSPDIPPLWQEAFTAGLTALLAEKFAPSRFAEKRRLYGGPGFRAADGGPPSAYEVARMGNRERADTVMIVHKGRRQRR
jgi:hypothetical protein